MNLVGLAAWGAYEVGDFLFDYFSVENVRKRDSEERAKKGPNFGLKTPQEMAAFKAVEEQKQAELQGNQKRRFDDYFQQLRAKDPNDLTPQERRQLKDNERALQGSLKIELADGLVATNVQTKGSTDVVVAETTSMQ